MTVFNGQTAKAGHFLQPTATAMGHRVMNALPEWPYSHPITVARTEAPHGYKHWPRKVSRASGSLACSEKFDAEMAGQTAAAFGHHAAVVPPEHRLHHGCGEVHPRARRLHRPVVAHASRRALRLEVPAPTAGELARGDAFHGSRTLHCGYAHLERQPIRQRARPGEAADRAHAIRIALFELDHRLHVAPPAWPVFDRENRVPNAVDRRREMPMRYQGVLPHYGDVVNATPAPS